MFFMSVSRHDTCLKIAKQIVKHIPILPLVHSKDIVENTIFPKIRVYCLLTAVGTVIPAMFHC